MTLDQVYEVIFYYPHHEDQAKVHLAAEEGESEVAERRMGDTFSNPLREKLLRARKSKDGSSGAH